MSHNYLSYITDQHLIECISHLYDAYETAKSNIDKRKFYKNKIDTFKLTFDAEFNNIEQEEIIKLEIMRQIDKSINNAIGTFHEEILGGIHGYEKGQLDGYDIKAVNDTLFADIKNKHNTMNSSAAESLFQKLASYADRHKKANCYWVQVLAKNSFNEHWQGEINSKEYSHSRVYKISGDQFYALLTGNDHALYELYKVLPKAIADFKGSLKQDPEEHKPSGSVLNELSKNNELTLFDQITFENFGYYLGFNQDS